MELKDVVNFNQTIEQALCRERLNDPEDKTGLLYIASNSTEMLRVHFEKLFKKLYSRKPENSENLSFVQGMYHLSGLILQQLAEVLSVRRPSTNTLGQPVSEWDSSHKMVEVAVEACKMLVAFHQSSRYITTVAFSPDNDPYPELAMLKDCRCFSEFYSALAKEIPEFGTSLVTPDKQN